jgi:hypothetical protein
VPAHALIGCMPRMKIQNARRPLHFVRILMHVADTCSARQLCVAMNSGDLGVRFREPGQRSRPAHPDYLPHTRSASLTIRRSLLRDVEHPIAISSGIVQPVDCSQRRVVINVRTSAMRVPRSATQFGNPQGYRVVHPRVLFPAVKAKGRPLWAKLTESGPQNRSRWS